MSKIKKEAIDEKVKDILWESEAKYKALVEQIPAITYIAALNETSTTLYVSPQVEKLIGFSPEEYIKNPNIWLEQLHPDDRERVLSEIKSIHTSKKPFISVYRMIAKDGSIVWFRDHASILTNKNGKPLYLQGSMYDITESRNMMISSKEELEKQINERTVELNKTNESLKEEISIRKWFESELIDSEEKHRHIIESSMDGIGLAQDGKIIYVNNALCKMFGYREFELVGKSMWKIVSPEDIDVLKERAKNRIEGLVVSNRYEFIGLKKDESKIIVEVSTSRSFIYKERPTILSFFRDVTEQRNAQEMLYESRELYKLLLKTSPDAIVVSDLNANIIEVSEEAIKINGCKKAEELIGKNSFDLIVPEDHARARSGLVKVLKEGIIKNLEYNLIRKDGSRYLCEMNVSLVKDTAGNPKSFIAIIRDITERKMAEKLLVESEEKFRAIAEYSPNMIFINKKGRIVYANRKCEKVMGYKKEEFLSTTFNFTDLIAVESKELVMESFKKHAKGKEIPPYEYLLLNKSGKELPAIITTKLINYEGEKAILGIVTDITALKNAEAILKRDKNALEKLIKQKTDELLDAKNELINAKRLSDIGTLAATVAHELRNPLGVIRLAVFNLKRKICGLKSITHIANIEKKITESENIINELLYYSRIKMPKYEKINIYNILDECFEFAETKFKRQNITLYKKLNSIKNMSIEADSLQVTEVFNNILNNAYQSIFNKKGKIWVEANTENKKFIVIIIKDNGVGIDKDDINKIFDPFFTKKAKGTGLGLTICKELVNLHGGTLSIKSEKNKGTIVTIKIPIKRKHT